MPKVSSIGCDVGHRKRMRLKVLDEWYYYIAYVSLFPLYCTFMYYLCCHFEEITEIETRDTCMLLTLSHFRPLRCPLVQRAASGSETRPCHGPSANAAAVFPPCGVWTPPPRGRQWDTLQSIRQDSDCAALFRLPCVCCGLTQAWFTGRCCRCLLTGWNRPRSRWRARLKTLPARNL